MDLIDEKKKETKNYDKSIKNISSVDCIDVRLQSVVTYIYIDSRT
jgi:hypothetical protein